MFTAHFEELNFAPAYYRVLRALLRADITGNTRELLMPTITIIEPNKISLDTLPGRNFSTQYATAELLWYLSGSASARNIGKLARTWQKIARPRDNTVESNYGRYCFADGFSQWNYARMALLEDDTTRKATIAIHHPMHKYANQKDMTCTFAMHFMIRNGGLHLFVNMRSNDAWFGLPNDVFAFTHLQQLMLNDLNSVLDDHEKLSLGWYHHSANSLHLYDRHYKKAQEVVDAGLDESRYEFAKNLAVVNTSWRMRDKYAMPTEGLTKKELEIFVANVREQMYA